MSAIEFCTKKWLAVVLFMSMIPALYGCKVNLLEDIRLGNTSSITLGHRTLFVLNGRGTCQSVDVDWGDGTIERSVVPIPGRSIELDTSSIETRYLFHVYTGWGGGKTVTVKGNGCEGTVRGRFKADPSETKAGWNQPAPPGTSGVCQTIAGLPGMIPRMNLKISLPTVTRVRDIYAAAGGPLEFCLNDGDSDLTNNRGGFNVTISVDQLGPPPTP